MTLPTVEHARAQPRDELLVAALRLFATEGYHATSLQAIGEAAGYAKSTVLYHFATKEAVLEAALSPTIDRIEQVFEGVRTLADPAANRAFIVGFVDTVMADAFAASIFINQGTTLSGIPVIDRATAIIGGLATSGIREALATPAQRIRFGIVVGGIAYAVVAATTWPHAADIVPLEEARESFITLVGELLAPEHFAPPADSPTP